MDSEQRQPQPIDDHADTLADEPTLPDSEWPVDAKYLVAPEARTEEGAAEPATGKTRFAQTTSPPRGPLRRLPSWVPDEAGPLLIVLLGVLLAIAATTYLTTRGESEAATSATPPALPPHTTTGEETTTTAAVRRVSVPTVVGMDVDEARAALGEAGLRARVAREPSEEAEGRVLEQAPEPETDVTEGTFVALTVSAGEPSTRVPDVVGSTLVRARIAVERAGLRVRVRRVESSKPPGRVLAQAPRADADVDRSTIVTLNVAKEALVMVPDVEGISASDARRRLREAGLRSAVVEVDSDEPRGTVVGQSPRSGREVAKDSTVTLRVSSGPALVSVPDVTGLDEESARSQLSAAGFEVRVLDEATTDPARDGIVLSQSPSGGTQVGKGSTVTLTVGRVS